MNPLPPQAYTKDTLVKAYAWLQTQSEGIKEMATNPDILVSLYLKARLNGEGALERPSIQNFKSDLKNLAGMMGEFEPSSPLSSTTTSGSPTHGSVSITNATMTIPQASITSSLDAKSLSMIREVKDALNLSSDQEVFRLLISVGYKKLTSLIE